MDDTLVLARLGLSVVFIVAAIGKLADRPGSRQALADFGIPNPFVGPLVFILPAAELATALALLFAAPARLGGAAALVLFGAFVVGLTRALRRGETPDCHCFGQVHSEPASWLTVARNVALAIPATFVLAAGPGPSLTSWAQGHSAQELWLIATSCLAAAASVSALVLWRQNRRLRSTSAWTPPRPVRIGARAPRFSLPSVGGPAVNLEDLLVDELPCLLTFVAPGCGPCTTLLPDLAGWRETLAGRLVFAVVSAGDLDAAETVSREHGLTPVLSDEEGRVSVAYGVPGTPSSILVAPDGTVRSAPAAGQVAIEALIRVALAGATRPALVVHQVA